ncbi:MAG: tRNA-binding protein [Candidatus Eremiobacteraeota bacterium]|nr:tRNA-binding protein [Candidatus Eremiobacteraeota bacterium]
MEQNDALKAFETLDIRVGTITSAQPLEGARRPAYKVVVDFGAQIGTRQSSVQITKHYSPGELIGTRVIAVVNFPPKRIAGFSSEVLILGLPDENGAVVLVRPDRPVPDGGRLY